MKQNLFQRTHVNNIRIHVLPTKQFKTYAISAYIGTPLKEETVTPVALTPFVLRRGTKEYPETIQFRRKLDDLYGAGFGFDVYKRGDYQIVQLRMDTIQDQFVSGSGSLLKDSLHFLGSMLTNPLLESDGFRAKYVDAEKNTLQSRIEAVVNDKIRYAAERCIQEMCKNEPYRLHPLGQIEDLAAITPATLLKHYEQWLSSSVIDIYVVGNTTVEEVQPLIESCFHVDRKDDMKYDNKTMKSEVLQVNRVEEKLDVTQGKLNMGLRLPISYAHEQYPAALMYNGILGSYPHSKLFMNVREKASLAYYAASRFEGHKGILTIQTGIEIDNAEKTIDIIQKQLDSMKQGEISDLEFQQTQTMITNDLTEMQDSAFQMIAFDFNQIFSGKERSQATLVESIKQMSKKHIQAVAEQVQLDTIYFLRDRKGE